MLSLFDKDEVNEDEEDDDDDDEDEEVDNEVTLDTRCLPLDEMMKNQKQLPKNVILYFVKSCGLKKKEEVVPAKPKSWDKY